LAPASWHSHRYSVTPISWPGARAPARRAGNICSAPMTTHPGRGKRRNNHMPCSPFASNKEHSATRTLSTFDNTLKQPKGGSSEAYLEKGNAPLLHLLVPHIVERSKQGRSSMVSLFARYCMLYLSHYKVTMYTGRRVTRISHQSFLFLFYFHRSISQCFPGRH